jgi:2-amino-4-hydroxy-6-hydroxymethyldihydropteridine diphosphokinase
VNARLDADAPCIFIALGSNQGDPAANVAAALEALRQLSAAPVRSSSLWKSTPVDCPPGSPSFVNAVAEVKPLPGETPESLLLKLQQIERQFGRKSKKIPNEPRPLDLDLIAWGGETRITSTLTLPHPRAHLRKFVLAPLCELAPELTLPGQRSTVRKLLENLHTSERVSRITGA